MTETTAMVLSHDPSRVRHFLLVLPRGLGAATSLSTLGSKDFSSLGRLRQRRQ